MRARSVPSPSSGGEVAVQLAPPAHVRSPPRPTSVDRAGAQSPGARSSELGRLDGAVPGGAISSRTAASAGSPARHRQACRRCRTRRQRDFEPPALSVKRAWRPSPHRPQVDQVRGRDQQRGRPGCPSERARARCSSSARSSESASRLGDGVDPPSRAQVLLRQHLVRRRRAKVARNASTSSRWIVRPAAALCPPWRSRWRALALQAAEQVEARDRASGAGALVPGASSAISTGRPVVALGDSRGDDPDHARMPAVGGQHERVARRMVGDQRLGLEAGSGSRRRGARC